MRSRWGGSPSTYYQSGQAQQQSNVSFVDVTGRDLPQGQLHITSSSSRGRFSTHHWTVRCPITTNRSILRLVTDSNRRYRREDQIQMTRSWQLLFRQCRPGKRFPGAEETAYSLSVNWMARRAPKAQSLERGGGRWGRRRRRAVIASSVTWDIGKLHLGKQDRSFLLLQL